MRSAAFQSLPVKCNVPKGAAPIVWGHNEMTHGVFGYASVTTKLQGTSRSARPIARMAHAMSNTDIGCSLQLESAMRPAHKLPCPPPLATAAQRLR